ncbi:sensor histidine kinase [Methanohalobium sp.]|uniref:sensor histidine kinase n=1 Tax=Methanohalobium sp. TaxID=2837493 RepID=UPI0025CC7976|nr:sensor histidine kinase [Methanohalobium sp.]
MRELELHHRIKKNLQVISSLINLQSEKFDDENVVEAFKDTQNRIVSMSLVHQKLYQTSNLNNINFKDYIQDLLTHLTRLYGDNNITLDVDDIDNVYFNIDTIIPLAMLINELVSNSLKYAFSENESGEIKIMLHQIDNENYTLIVADNGIGIPEDIDIHDTDSLGFRLVNTLVDQIGGCLEKKEANSLSNLVLNILKRDPKHMQDYNKQCTQCSTYCTNQNYKPRICNTETK